jgi:hypothetical protein
MADRTTRIHETTQRSLARLAFVALGLVPLMLCLWLSAATFLPGHSSRQAAAWQQGLQELYGLSFKIKQAQALAPYRYVLDEVQLIHPETDRTLGSVKQIAIQLIEGQWKVKLLGGQFSWDQSDDMSRFFHQWYMCRPNVRRHPALIEADQLELRDGQRSFSVLKLDAQVFPERERWAVKATFRPSMPANHSPMPDSQLLMVRHHDPEDSATEIQLRAASDLPGWLILPLLSGTASADPNSTSRLALESCSFSGVLDVRSQKQGDTAYLTDARLSSLDLSRITSGQSTILSGQGSINIARAMLGSRGLLWAEGTFEMGPGRVDTAFLGSLSRYLDLDMSRQNPVGVTSFDRLSASFRLMPQQLQLVGRLSPEGGMLEDAHGPLVARRDESPLPIENVVYALVGSQPTLGRRALAWLPMEDSQRQQASSVLRISRN